MIHGGTVIIAADLDHFEQKLFGGNENLQDEYWKWILGHIHAHNMPPLQSKSANFTK